MPTWRYYNAFRALCKERESFYLVLEKSDFEGVNFEGVNFLEKLNFLRKVEFVVVFEQNECYTKFRNIANRASN